MPEIVDPVLSGAPQVVFAKGQPQYRQLPATVHLDNPQGPVTSRWRFTDEERQAIAAGADLYLTLLTFLQPLQPILLQVFEKEGQAEETLRQQGYIPGRSPQTPMEPCAAVPGPPDPPRPKNDHPVG